MSAPLGTNSQIFSRTSIKAHSYRYSSPVTSKRSSIKGSQTEQNLNLPFWLLSTSHESRYTSTIFQSPQMKHLALLTGFFSCYSEHQWSKELPVYLSFSSVTFLCCSKLCFRSNTGGRHWMDLEAGQGKKRKPLSTTAEAVVGGKRLTQTLLFSSHTHSPQYRGGNRRRWATQKKNCRRGARKPCSNNRKAKLYPCCLQLQPPSLLAAGSLQEELSQAHDATLKRTALISGCQAALWNKPSFLPARKLFSYQQPSFSIWAI